MHEEGGDRLVPAFNIFISLVLREKVSAIFLQHLQKKESKDPAGDHFADADRQHEERYAAFEFIYISKNEGDDENVGNDGRKRATDLVGHGLFRILGLATLADQISSDRAKERCDAAKHNVQEHAVAQIIRQDASDKESGDRCRREKGKDGECFREADLNGVIRQPQGICQKGENDIKSSNGCCLSDE